MTKPRLGQTHIYGFRAKGACRIIGSTDRAMRSAAQVWLALGKKHFDWSVENTRQALTDEVLSTQLWELVERDDVLLFDRILLGITFDDVLVRREDVPALQVIMRSFEPLEGHGCTLAEQADILDKLPDDVVAVGWQHDSLSECYWMRLEDCPSCGREMDEERPYDLGTDREHRFLVFNPERAKEIGSILEGPGMMVGQQGDEP